MIEIVLLAASATTISWILAITIARRDDFRADRVILLFTAWLVLFFLIY